MKFHRLLAVMLLLAAAAAGAQPVTSRPWISPSPPPPIGSFNTGGVIFVEREYVPVIVEKEVVTPLTLPSPARGEGQAEPRKPYVIGRNYRSLPTGCMKIIEGGTSYFYCGGEWYREVGAAQYRAVGHP